jgi:hypothetical protein
MTCIHRSKATYSNYSATSNQWFYATDPLEMGVTKITPSQQILTQLKKGALIKESIIQHPAPASTPESRPGGRRKSLLFEPFVKHAGAHCCKYQIIAVVVCCCRMRRRGPRRNNAAIQQSR